MQLLGVVLMPVRENGETVLDLSNQSGITLLRSVTSLLPRVPEGLAADRHHELVAEEAAVLDFVTSFGHTVNSADIDAVVSAYADDCTWMSPRGQFVGSEEIRRNYGLYYDPVRWFNFWTNITVRFVDPFDEAYVCAYQYSVGVDSADPLAIGGVSTDVWRLKRSGETWKIAERRIDLLDTHNGHRFLPAAGA